MRSTLPACRVFNTVPMTASWYCLNLESNIATLAITGNPFLPCRVRINLTPLRWRWVYPSPFHWASSSCGTYKVAYCSACDAWRAHWSSRDDWIYSFGAGILVEIRVLILRVKEFGRWYSLYGLMRGIEDSLIWADSRTYKYSTRFSIF